MGRNSCLLTTLCLALVTGCHVNNNDSSAAASAGTSAFYYQSGGTGVFSGKTAAVSGTDVSGVCVDDAGTLNMTSCTLTSSSACSSIANSQDYGLDAVALAKNASTLNLTGGQVSSSSLGATGVFATGSGSTANLTDVEIVTTGTSAPGVAATLGGALALSGCTVTTSGTSSPALGMADGTGTVTITGGTLATSGTSSPVLQCQGTVAITGATLSAGAGNGAQIQGARTVTLTSTSLAVSGTGQYGVLLYQSGTPSGTATFTMTGGSLAAGGGPVFFVSNTTADITLEGVTVTAGSGVLVEAAVTTAYGSAGGTATLTARAQTLAGNLVVDDASSSVALVLSNASTLTGAVTGGALTLDTTSTWKVTGTSHLTTFSDPEGITGTAVANVTGNNHTVYYLSAANPALAGLTYTLAGGGTLVPE
jgi:hypothetical protein